MKKQGYRHGEIVFELIDKLPEGLELSKSKSFLIGSHGNSHTYDNGKLYLKNEGIYIFGYFVSKNTKLYHTEHSPKGAKIEDGIYRLRRAVEFINGELRIVID